MRFHLLVITLFGVITLSYSQTNKSAKQILVEHENTYGSKPSVEVNEELIQENENFEDYKESIIATPEENTFQGNLDEDNKDYLIGNESGRASRDLNKVLENRKKSHYFKIVKIVLMIVLVIGILWYAIKHYEDRQR